MITLLKELVNIPSISGEELEVGRALSHILKKKNFDVREQMLDDGAFNILASPGGRPKVILCTHMDTVAPFFPFRRKGDLFYGRGTCDAKGQIVAMIKAAEKLRAQGIDDFAMLFVVGEETTSRGAKKATQLDLDSDYVVIGEPTDNKLAVGQKGVLAFELRATGTGGHSSLPHLGESAIHKLLDILQVWRNLDWGSDDLLGQSLLNIGEFSGGVGLNVLAPDACARGMFRIATSLEDIHAKINTTLSADVELNILSESEPQRLLTIPGFDTQVVGFGTDAAHVRNMGEIVLYGPGTISVAHRSDEHVSLHDLELAVKDYVKIVKHLLAL